MPPQASSPSTLILIDGHALAFRFLHALRRDKEKTPVLTNSRGEPTDAIKGFLQQLIRFCGKSSNQVVVTFDTPVKTFRHERYPEYKAGRASSPEDIHAQIDRLREIVRAMGIPCIERPGYEADDVIGTLARLGEAHGMQVRIITNDRDSYQLITENVSVVSGDKVWGEEEVLEKYGVTVGQWIDFRSLMGDTSDNIPGAKGIGEKIAKNLLQEYGSLEAIYQAAKAGLVKPDGVRKKLLDSEENVQLSLMLSKIVTDIDIDINLGVGRSAGNPALLASILQELELQTIARSFAALATVTPAAEEESAAQIVIEPLVQLAEETWQKPSGSAVIGYVLSAEDDLTAVITQAAYAEAHTAVFPINEPPEWKKATYVLPESLFGAAEPSKKAQKEQEKAQKESEKILAKLKLKHPAFVAEADFDGIKNIHAAKAKTISAHLNVRGIEAEPADDPLLMAYLLDTSNTDMQTVTQKYLSTDWPSDATGRANISAHLLRHLPKHLTEAQKNLYDRVEKPLSAVLMRMETRGISLDCGHIQALATQAGVTLSELEKQIYHHAGEEFQVRSPKQLEAILYDKLGLESGKKTKLTKQRSTAVASLEPLRSEHPIIPLILEYRELDKLRGTYLEPLPNMVNPTTGRLHTTFDQTTAATGRLSSLNPNLQNIPIRTQQGREIRKGFVAAPGCLLLGVDYSQIELRLLAHISGDKLMQQAFIEGADIHRRTAATLFGISESEVESSQRRAAKTVNFGVLYGMSAHRLSGDLGISYEEAAGFIKAYFDTYPDIRQYIENTLEFGRTHGYVETIYGRRRYVPEINAANRTLREAGERLSYNTPIQGTAADIIKMAMVELDKRLIGTGAHMLLQVHDELLLEVPQDCLEEISALTRSVMEEIAELSVPLSVEVGSGANWYDTK